MMQANKTAKSSATVPGHTVSGQENRRQFLRSAAGMTAAATFGNAAFSSRLFAGTEKVAAPETLVSDFVKTLSDEQKQAICMPVDHELRSRVNANWHITKPTIGEDFYTTAQRDLIRNIVQGVTSEDGYQRLQRQMDDDSGGLNDYSVAVFGDPGQSGFQFALTGRHLTLRADGNRADKVAFGGPIVYGHGEEEIRKNLFFYQTEQANQVFQSLSKEQSAKALLTKAPAEAAVDIQGASGMFPGIRVGELQSEQQTMVEKTLGVLLAPYRAEDVAEVMEILKDSDGLQQLHMAFYRQDDADNDELWDLWRVEGPSFVWHFRGAPHVHAYINIGVVKS